MKTFVKHLIALFLRFAFWFRYKVTVKGLEKLNKTNLNKSGGTLFLPNHPSVFVDPSLVTLAVWPKFPIRPMIVEYQFYTPIVNSLMRYLDALPIPSFTTTSNSLKKRKSDKVIETVIQDLRNGQNFLIYPAGRTKQSGFEAIGGSSAVQKIVNEAPEANIVLVRVKGLWGSSFSRAYTGKAPPMFQTIWLGMKHVFKNLLLFTPRRHVIIELEPAPVDFPYKGTRLEINKYLEAFYNKPDGLTQQTGNYPGDSLIKVSYSTWSDVFYDIPPEDKSKDSQIKLESISEDVKQKVIKRLSEIAEIDPALIKPEMNLSVDIGMDSLDVSEVAIFLQESFEVRGVPNTELTSVGKVMAIAAKQIVFKEEIEEDTTSTSKWKEPLGPRNRIDIAPGKIVPEVFLNNCDRMGSAIAFVDERSGILTYRQLKLRVLLLAEYIQSLEGEYLGILLPSSVGATLLILATQLAGKVPLLINWTVGPRHLESVTRLSNVKHVLTSWAFLDRLENVDLKGIEEMLLMLEEQRHHFTLAKKLKAFFWSKRSTASILKRFNLAQQSEDSKAVLLFTSGTESMPKGVPLSHKNLLSNQRAAMEGLVIYSDDIFLSMLPPFHAFGFTITTLIPPLSGLKSVYSPDPTDGKRLARAIEKWGATIICGTPSFIKGVMKAAKPEQLKTVRICFTGAEKAPPELFDLMTRFFGTKEFFLEGYGITECSPILTFNREGKEHIGVGLPAQGVELCIVHPENYEIQPGGKQGLILARGPNIFNGYLNPGLTSPFVELQGVSWYKTGDLGYLDQEGNLTISGRLKRFIKIGAEMVSLAALEDALLQTGLNKGWPITHEGPALAICAKEFPTEKAKIYLFTTFPTTADDINTALREAGFSNLVKVSNTMHLPEIPLMGSGKINYRLLETDYLPKLDTEKKETNTLRL
jgi:acyl-CoA synthetase (AMP-forming)/AMP-acid ligase II/1-acyl-sn-glycerol-3-phosphate acyltransferase/acyl carrier protein